MTPRAKPQRRVAVFGLGLMGGSLARDLAAQGWHVMAHDRDEQSLREAEREGVVHQRIGEGAVEADAAVFAVPVFTFPKLLRAMAPQLANVPLVMDVSSTKRSAVAAAEAAGLGERFVGSHPMTGHHLSGWSASRPVLFDGATVFLCRTPSSTGDALDRACAFWENVGAKVHTLDALAHDRLVAFTSHLPQLVSRALALAIADGGAIRTELGPGGRDATRLAGSGVDLWTSIMLDNADLLLVALTRYEARQATLRRALERRDVEALRTLLGTARQWTLGA